MDNFYLGAYWGDRRESLSECADRLAQCLTALGEIDDLLQNWYLRGKSRTSATMPVGLDPEVLGGLLAKGVNRRDVGGEVLDDLGFSIDLWNRARPAIAMGGTVGAHAVASGVVNSFTIELPTPNGEAERLFEPGAAQRILESIVDAWEPAWATWTSARLRNLQYTTAPTPVLGWMTYFSRPISVDLDEATVKPLGQGAILTLGGDAQSVREEDLIAAREHLSALGALS